MKYRELIEQYKQNTLDQNKRAEVEADIDKQEAIGDFLYERSEIPGLHEGFEQSGRIALEENEASKQEREFTKMVNRSIRRAFLKMGAVVGAVVLVIILFIQFALSPIVASFYYNPGELVEGDTKQMSLDMAVYTGLTMPGYARDNISVKNNGYGNYDICIYQNVSYNGIFTNVSGRIEKGSLTLYDVNALKKPTGNAFAWFQVHGGSEDSLTELVAKGQTIFCAAGNAADATKALNNLDDTTKYVAYVTLDKMMSYEAFMQAFGSEDHNYVSWCAVRTSSDGDANNFGFECGLSNSSSLSWNREEYPNLMTWETSEIGEDNMDEVMVNITKVDFMKTHFVSMLRYISKQEDFLTMMEESAYDYSQAADYVEEHGIEIYGFATTTDKENLLKLNELDNVYEIYTQVLK